MLESCVCHRPQDAAKLSPHVPPPTAIQKEALAFVQEVAREERLRFDYQLTSGALHLLGYTPDALQDRYTCKANCAGPVKQ